MAVDSDGFVLFTLARDFVILIFQDRFTPEDLRSIEILSVKLIDTYRLMVAKMNLTFNTTPKLHKIIHYAENIRRFGPLRISSTLRHERGHQTGKSWSRQMGCWKNPVKTIAHRVARVEAIYYFEKPEEAPEIPSTSNISRYLILSARSD